MKYICMKKQVNVNAEQAYQVLADFKSFEDHCQSVIAVNVEGINETESYSSWQVHFHDGQMFWKEHDVFTPDTFKIAFTQVEGDAETFSGVWQVTELSDEKAEVTFSAEFCMGIPTLADILEPIAEQAIKDNIDEMLSQLFPQLDREDECDVKLEGTKA